LPLHSFSQMKKKKIIIAIFIIIFGFAFRVFLNEQVGIPNFEALTALSLVSGSFLGGVFAPIIPLLMAFSSDIYFGNTSVYLFTWSAFALAGILGTLVRRNSKHRFLKITGLGVLSVLFFYFWTNFGWWLTSGMYQMTFSGLIRCYIAALPFLKNQLISVLIFTPSFFASFSLIFDKVSVRENKKYENSAFVSKIS